MNNSLHFADGSDEDDDEDEDEDDDDDDDDDDDGDCISPVEATTTPNICHST